MSEDHYDDYSRWLRWSYEQLHGRGSWNGEAQTGGGVYRGLVPYDPPLKRYWDGEESVGVMEAGGRFIGVACLAAKEVADKESYVRRFGLSFEKDIQWRAVSGLLDHLSRSPVFKAVLITTNELPFTLQPDVSDELEGRRNWARRNFQFHKEKADTLRRQLKETAGDWGGPFPKYLPKQMKEEEDYARRFLEQTKSLESQMVDHMKPYFLIKENLFAAALFFYVYTSPREDARSCLADIVARRYSARMEMEKTYFVKCADVRDPAIVFHPEFAPFLDEVRKFLCLTLAQDCAGFNSDKDVGVALKAMFTTVLELPTEEPIEEQIHFPTKDVAKEGPRRAFLGYAVKSVIKRENSRLKVNFPLDVLTSHAVIFGKTRSGKSFLSLIIIKEALANDIAVKVFDPHGTLADRLKEHRNLTVFFTKGRSDITEELQHIYDEASEWPETNELKQLVVLDETRLLKAKNLAYCINELGKRGVGFVLITQYSTSISPEIRNVGTYFIMAVMSETEIKRFKDVTLHPSSKLITRLPRAVSYVFSPYWYPEPFFIRHRKLAGAAKVIEEGDE